MLWRKANMRDNLEKLPLCHSSVLCPHIAFLPLLRPTWSSVLLHQASPVTQLTPVKIPVDWGNDVPADRENKKEKKEKYKRKKNSHMMHQELKAWISLAQQRRRGRKKRKINIKKSSLRSLTHWVGRMAGRRWQYTMSKKFKCLLPRWGNTSCTLCWGFSYLPKSWKAL